jgi:hypothetical protein
MWHLGRQMSDLSVQTKLDSFFKPALSHSNTTSESSVGLEGLEYTE